MHWLATEHTIFVIYTWVWDQEGHHLTPSLQADAPYVNLEQSGPRPFCLKIKPRGLSGFIHSPKPDPNIRHLCLGRVCFLRMLISEGCNKPRFEIQEKETKLAGAINCSRKSSCVFKNLYDVFTSSCTIKCFNRIGKSQGREKEIEAMLCLSRNEKTARSVHYRKRWRELPRPHRST